MEEIEWSDSSMVDFQLCRCIYHMIAYCRRQFFIWKTQCMILNGQTVGGLTVYCVTTSKHHNMISPCRPIFLSMTSSDVLDIDSFPTGRVSNTISINTFYLWRWRLAIFFGTHMGTLLIGKWVHHKTWIGHLPFLFIGFGHYVYAPNTMSTDLH